MARNNLEDRSDSSEDDSNYTGNKRKKERPSNIDKVPRKSIRKKPDKVPKGGAEKEKVGGDKKLI